VVRPIETQMTVRDLMQIVVYQFDQPVERGLVTRTPGFDKLGDFAAGGWCPVHCSCGSAVIAVRLDPIRRRFRLEAAS
jgi:hypothetical protein